MDGTTAKRPKPRKPQSRKEPEKPDLARIGASVRLNASSSAFAQLPLVRDAFKAQYRIVGSFLDPGIVGKKITVFERTRLILFSSTSNTACSKLLPLCLAFELLSEDAYRLSEGRVWAQGSTLSHFLAPREATELNQRVEDFSRLLEVDLKRVTGAEAEEAQPTPEAEPEADTEAELEAEVEVETEIGGAVPAMASASAKAVMAPGPPPAHRNTADAAAAAAAAAAAGHDNDDAGGHHEDEDGYDGYDGYDGIGEDNYLENFGGAHGSPGMAAIMALAWSPGPHMDLDLDLVAPGGGGDAQQQQQPAVAHELDGEPVGGALQQQLLLPEVMAAAAAAVAVEEPAAAVAVAVEEPAAAVAVAVAVAVEEQADDRVRLLQQENRALRARVEQLERTAARAAIVQRKLKEFLKAQMAYGLAVFTDEFVDYGFSMLKPHLK